MDEEWQEEVLDRLDEILVQADDWHYWDEAETNGFVSVDDLAVEIQWQLDYNDLEAWYEDAEDGTFDEDWGYDDWEDFEDDDWEDFEDEEDDEEDWEDWEDEDWEDEDWEDYFEAPEEISELAQDIAEEIMWECDIDGDDLCTLDEQAEAIADLEIDWDDEEDAMWGDKLLEILDNADWTDYWEGAEFDGFVTLEDLELEVQWQLDHSDLQEMIDEDWEEEDWEEEDWDEEE